MKRHAVLAIAMLVLMTLVPTVSQGQRRARPGSMKHTQGEVENARKITELKCKYIKDGSAFEGPIYMTGEAGAIKIGDGVIFFNKGHYMLSFDAAKFHVKRHFYMTPEERRERGISEYEYQYAWDNRKIGEDFEYGGKYETYEQYGKKWLVLYQGESTDVYAKIPLSGVNDSSFSLTEDDIYLTMKYVKR